jgi:hypothetical protein
MVLSSIKLNGNHFTKVLEGVGALAPTSRNQKNWVLAPEVTLLHPLFHL